MVETRLPRVWGLVLTQSSGFISGVTRTRVDSKALISVTFVGTIVGIDTTFTVRTIPISSNTRISTKRIQDR